MTIKNFIKITIAAVKIVAAVADLIDIAVVTAIADVIYATARVLDKGMECWIVLL